MGLLIVHVMEGRDLKKMDMIGKADPFLEMYTQPTAVEKTVRGIPTAFKLMDRCLKESPQASTHPAQIFCTCMDALYSATESQALDLAESWVVPCIAGDAATGHTLTFL